MGTRVDPCRSGGQRQQRAGEGTGAALLLPSLVVAGGAADQLEARPSSSSAAAALVASRTAVRAPTEPYARRGAGVGAGVGAVEGRMGREEHVLGSYLDLSNAFLRRSGSGSSTRNTDEAANVADKYARLWGRPLARDLLFLAGGPSRAQTTIKVASGDRQEAWKEVPVLETDTNSTNSTSLLRAPSALADFVRGSSSNFPFMPGSTPGTDGPPVLGHRAADLHALTPGQQVDWTKKKQVRRTIPRPPSLAQETRSNLISGNFLARPLAVPYR